MKTFEVSVKLTIEAADELEASEKVEGVLDYMMEVANEGGDLIAYSVLDDVEEVED